MPVLGTTYAGGTARRRAWRRIAPAFLVFACLATLLLGGCAEEPAGSPRPPSGGSAPSSPSTPASSPVPLSSTAAQGASFTPPASPALTTQTSYAEDPLIDVSHVDEGYVSVLATNASRLKFQVAKGEAVYNYDMPNDGTAVSLPINMGDGDYEFRIMQNTSGSNYVLYANNAATVTLTSEFAPYLIPNMFCDYHASSACVARAREVAASSQNQGEAVRDVCTYVAGHVTYDTEKAALLSTVSGYVPDPDETLASGTGICFDYSSLSAAMLRSLGLPTKIVTGYVSPDDIYHAWIMVYVDGTWVTGLFRVDPNTWSRVDVTFAASGATEYVGEGLGYTDRYVY